MNKKYLLFCSGGNDSIALLQLLREFNKKNVTVMYNETQLEANGWLSRIESIRKEVESIGWKFVITRSEGFANMVRRKKGFPMAASNKSFCTMELKKKPTIEWLNKNDPEQRFICCAGIRQEESQNRKNHPAFIYRSDLYDNRKRWFPMVRMKEDERNDLIKRFGFEVLPHSSMECFPCINSNRSDFRLLAMHQDRIQMIEDLENEMGFTSKGKPRFMFRPYRHMGAEGIREVVKWGLSERGKYKK